MKKERRKEQKKGKRKRSGKKSREINLPIYLSTEVHLEDHPFDCVPKSEYFKAIFAVLRMQKKKKLSKNRFNNSSKIEHKIKTFV